MPPFAESVRVSVSTLADLAAPCVQFLGAERLGTILLDRAFTQGNALGLFLRGAALVGIVRPLGTEIGMLFGGLEFRLRRHHQR